MGIILTPAAAWTTSKDQTVNLVSNIINLDWFSLRLVHTKLKLQPTGFRLASDSEIGVNETMLYQCNPSAFYQSEASQLQIKHCSLHYDEV